MLIMKGLRLVRIFVLILLLTVPAVHALGGRGEFRHLDSNRGLSDLVVNSIFKDSRGYVWLGTGLGLDRFDGNNIRSFPIPGENLNAKRVKAIAEGPRHEIFMGNAAGLFVVSSTMQDMVPVFPDKINMSVNALACKGDTLYVATDAGMFILDVDSRKLSRFLLDPDVMSNANSLTAMHLTPAGNLWVASPRGLNRFDASQRHFNSFVSHGPYTPTAVTSIGDTIFVATHGGGVRPFLMRGERFLEPIEVGNDIVTGLTAVDGTLVAATDGTGVFVCSPDGNILRHYEVGASPDFALRSNSVYSVLVDEKRLLWVGYYQDGADYTPYTRRIFEVYSLPGGGFSTLHRAVRAVAVDGAVKLIGTREGLYYVDGSTREMMEFKSPQIRSNIIFCVRKWRGRYYIGTYNGGMYTFDPSARRLEPFVPGAGFDSRESVFVIASDRSDNLWIGTSRGLYRLDASGDLRSTKCFTNRNSHLPQGNIYEIFFDSTDRGWICTETGLAIWDGSMIRTDGFPQGFVNKQKIRDIFEDRNHNLYFLPDRGDICRSNLQLTEFAPLQGISAATNRAATFISEDADGMLWIGSEMGLMQFDGQETLRYFSLSDGLPSNVFTFCNPVKGENGDLWLGNNQGLVRLDLNRLRGEASLKSLPELTEIASNGRSVFSRLHRGRRLLSIDLDSKENNLTLWHANFDYIQPDDQMVEYMLDGYDDSWTMKTGHGRISYYDLPPGKYRFRIRHAGDPTSETGYDIRIRPSVNLLAVIMFLCLLAAGGTAVYFYLLHRRHRREASAMQERESELLEEADRKAREVELKRYRTTRLSEEECRRLHRKLEGLMKSERPFTNPDLKSGDLAAMIGSSAHALSFLFNQYLHKNYYDYVNEYRVAEFKRLVGEFDTSRYTLTAMSQMCGFSSRASFFRHFKNLTGITPADYLKSLKK